MEWLISHTRHHSDRYLNRMVVALILLLVIVTMLVTRTLYLGRIQFLREAEQSAKSTSRIMEYSISNILEKIDYTLQVTSDEVVRYRQIGSSRHELLQFIERQFRRTSELDSLRVADAEGVVIFGSGTSAFRSVNISDRDYFISLKNNPDAVMVISKPIIGRISGKWVVTCARRISLPDNSFGGVVYGVVAIDQIYSLFEKAAPGKNGSIALRSKDMTLIARYSANLKNRIAPNTGNPDISSEWQQMLAKDGATEGSYVANSVTDGIKRYFYYRLVKPYQLYLNVGISTDDYLKQWRKEAALTGMALSGGWAGFLLLAGQIYRYRRQTDLESTIAERTQELVETTGKLEKNEQRLKALLDISQYQAQDIAGLLDHALQKVIDVTQSRIGYIYHYNEDSQEFVLNTWSKEVMSECNVVNPLSVYHLEKTGVWGEAVRQGKPILLNDFNEWNPLKKGYPEGHVHLSRFLTVPVFDAGKHIVAVVGVANKEQPYTDYDVQQLDLMMAEVWRIAKRLELEMKVINAGKEWQTTFDAISDSVSLIDREQRVLRCNLASTRLLNKNFNEIIGRNCCELIHKSGHQADDCPMLRAIESRRTESLTIFENSRWLHITVDPLLDEKGEVSGAIHIVRDETERVEAEQSLRDMHAQLLQNEKMASIGQLSAGIAHEINNPMGFINSNLETLEKYIDKFDRYIGLLEQIIGSSCDSSFMQQALEERKFLKLDYVQRDIRQLIDESSGGAERVMRIVQDLKIFARSDSTKTGRADFNVCLDSTINIIWNQIKYVAELKRDYGELPKVSCNIQQINQVFMNLLVNACNAIEEKGLPEPGVITVSTWADTENAFVSVRDTGNGIPEELHSRIFEPFFTTKEVGKGTGLGLSISSEIMRKHGGSLSFESVAGEGTVFTVRLPLVPFTAPDRTGSTAS